MVEEGEIKNFVLLMFIYLERQMKMSSEHIDCQSSGCFVTVYDYARIRRVLLVDCVGCCLTLVCFA